MQGCTTSTGSTVPEGNYLDCPPFDVQIVALTWFQIAAREWVPNITLVTDTDGHMVTDSAVSIDTTETRTGVLAMPVDAGKLA